MYPLIDLAFPLLAGLVMAFLISNYLFWKESKGSIWLFLHGLTMLAPLFSLFLYSFYHGQTPAWSQWFVDWSTWCWGAFFYMFYRLQFADSNLSNERYHLIIPAIGIIISVVIFWLKLSGLHWIKYVYLVAFTIALAYQGMVIKGLWQYRLCAQYQLSNVNFIAVSALIVLSVVQWSVVAYDAGLMLRTALRMPVHINEFIVIYFLEAVSVVLICLLMIKQKINSIKPLEKESTDNAILDDATADELMKSIRDLMLDSKIYRDPSLSLDSLSHTVGIRRNIVSEVLNRHAGMPFYQFVNSYRLTEVANELAATDKASKTVTQIALDAGFGNKATFNREFKKSYQQTPSQFRQMSLQNRGVS